MARARLAAGCCSVNERRRITVACIRVQQQAGGLHLSCRLGDRAPSQCARLAAWELTRPNLTRPVLCCSNSRALLSSTSTPQEGLIPLLRRLRTGRWSIAWTLIGQPLPPFTILDHACEPPHVILETAITFTRPTTPSPFYREHLQIGISFLVPVCLSTAHRPPARPRPPPQSESAPWRCRRRSPPCTRRPSPDPGAIAATCPRRGRCLAHTVWDPRASTSGT
jgi:hypothetical protein